MRITGGCSHGPAGEDVRKRRYISLRVTPVHSEGMQLHNFTGIILVDAVSLAVAAIDTRRNVLPIVEIHKHRGMLGSGQQQIAESSKRMRPDRIFFVGARPHTSQLLVFVYVEMVVPEIHERFVQAIRTRDRTHESGLSDLRANLHGELLEDFDLVLRTLVP